MFAYPQLLLLLLPLATVLTITLPAFASRYLRSVEQQQQQQCVPPFLNDEDNEVVIENRFTKLERVCIDQVNTCYTAEPSKYRLLGHRSGMPVDCRP